MIIDPKTQAESLPCWRGPVAAEPLPGGMTNTNFVVRDGGRKVRGADRRRHPGPSGDALQRARGRRSRRMPPGCRRRSMHAEPGALVMRFVEGRTLGAGGGPPARDAAPRRRARAPLPPRGAEAPARPGADLLALPCAARLRRDARGGRGAGGCPSCRGSSQRRIERFERELGPTEIVFGHNDLLPSNLIDDGERLWLIDWDYAGFSTPLFDLANLATNSEPRPGRRADAPEALLRRRARGRPRRAASPACAASRSCARRSGAWRPRSIRRSISTAPAYTARQLARFEEALRRLEKTA